MADPASNGNGNGSNGRGAMVQWASTVLTLVIAIGTMVNNFSRDTSGQLAALEERSQKRNEQANDTCRQLWRRVYGEDLPAYEYHPQISQKR